MSALPHLEYFLGANAPGGFYSLSSELLRPEEARAIYILKGGPGCGKSTLMRRVGERMEEERLTPEYILCSGDPDSLDALVLPELRVALVDGTAPHVVEPRCPGAVERYVNLGACYDTAALAPCRDALLARATAGKICRERAVRCLRASAEILEDMRATVLTDALREKLARRARGILSRELKRRRPERTGRVSQRFLGAVTHQGPVCLFGTAQAQCHRVFELRDAFGLAHELLLPLLAGALENGWDVTACPDPMAPERLAHLLIPQASLAFVTSTAALPFPGEPSRRIRLDQAADREILRRCRPRLRFSRKVSAALLEEAADSLGQAKACHDALEALYHPHVDFTGVDRAARAIEEEILSFLPASA